MAHKKQQSSGAERANALLNSEVSFGRITTAEARSVDYRAMVDTPRSPSERVTVQCPNCQATIDVSAHLTPCRLNVAATVTIEVTPVFSHDCPPPRGREPLPIAIGA